MPKAITITSSLEADKLIFSHMEGWEELGRPFEFKLFLHQRRRGHQAREGARPEPDRQRRVSRQAEAPFQRRGRSSFARITETKDNYFCYEAIVRPKLWYLTYTSDCKIFQQKTVPDIIKLVLDDHGITRREEVAEQDVRGPRILRAI